MKHEITKEKAKELIEHTERGTLILCSREEIPAIGKIPEDERESTLEIQSYSFGTLDKATEGDGSVQ